MRVSAGVLGLVFLGLFFSSCEKKSRVKDVDIKRITKESLTLKRYEQALFSISADSLREGLKRISGEYKVFLDADLNDTLNLLKVLEFVNDPVFRQLKVDVDKVFPDPFVALTELEKGFRYMRLYYPGFKLPVVYTYVSGLDFEQPVKLFDNALIIAIDMYLGPDYPMYSSIGLPRFRTHWMRPECISADCFREYAGRYLKQEQPRTILDYMIMEGKKLYFLDAMMPALHDSIKLRYTFKQLQWAHQNQANLWTFFVENSLLFSTETTLIKKFVTDSPFTSQFSKDAPGRILWFVGFEIVRKYMDRNRDVSLQDLMENKMPQEILEASGYKPVNKSFKG
jgi:hypothetical protein